MPRAFIAVVAILLCSTLTFADSPATQPSLPHIQVDVKKKQIRVDCEALNVDIPLEFFCVTDGGNEHESILRTPAKPSHMHLALLMLGLQPGEPIKYSEAAQKWFPPHGPPLHISVEFQKDGKTITMPANQLMRDIKTKQAMPALTWIFAGSRVLDDGTYGADPTGYVVSICNFDLCLIDVPELVSSANETLEWERNPDTVPPTGTPVTMIIEPAGRVEAPAEQASAPPTGLTVVVKVAADNHAEMDGRPIDPDQLADQLGKMKATGPLNARLAVASGADATVVKKITDAMTTAGVAYTAVDAAKVDAEGSSGHLSDVSIDQPKIDRLKEIWNKKVGPHDAALREAAQAQYEVLTELRREQQRLIDEADRVQRTIDELEKQYQDMTTPQPEPIGPTTQP